MVLALLLLAATLQAPVPLPTIEAKAPKDREMVLSLNQTLSKLTEKVTSCVDAGRPVETCRCNYPQELAALRTKYDDVIDAEVLLTCRTDESVFCWIETERLAYTERL